MSQKTEYRKIWRLVYRVYPPILRVLEKFGFHSGRQKYTLGFLNEEKYSPEEFLKYLENHGFEPAILAWKDSDEVFSLRRVHNHKFQWHIRLHSDGEIRGHYEYSSEGNPVGHILESIFVEEKAFFSDLLKDYLI